MTEIDGLNRPGHTDLRILRMEIGHQVPTIPGGHFHIRRSGALAPKFASEIHVRAPNFASKNMCRA